MTTMRPGDCFYNKAVPGIPSHRWVIVSDPEQDQHNVLIVNFTDADDHHDTTCVFTPTDIPWLTKRTCMAYQFAKLTSIQKLEEAEAKGLLFGHCEVSEEALALIREGVSTSEELKKTDYLELLRSQGLA